MEADSLVGFYRDGTRDAAGRTLDQILAWPDDRLEAVHDYIQWMFPLPERSGANPGAPVLNAAAMATFRADAAMQQKLRSAFLRMLAFYGFRWRGDAVERDAAFHSRAAGWLSVGNHNHLRLTRMLRSLRLLGLEPEARALFAALEAVEREFPDRILPDTGEYWRWAMNQSG